MILMAAAVPLPLQAGAAGFRQRQSWQFRTPSKTRVKLDIEARRLELRSPAQGNGTTAVSRGGKAALAPDCDGTASQSGFDAANVITVATLRARRRFPSPGAGCGPLFFHPVAAARLQAGLRAPTCGPEEKTPGPRHIGRETE